MIFQITQIMFKIITLSLKQIVLPGLELWLIRPSSWPWTLALALTLTPGASRSTRTRDIQAALVFTKPWLEARDTNRKESVAFWQYGDGNMAI